MVLRFELELELFRLVGSCLLMETVEEAEDAVIVGGVLDLLLKRPILETTEIRI